MTMIVVFGSCVFLIAVLWIFKRLAWGGGMFSPSYGLLKPQPSAASGALPEADHDSIEIRCRQCDFVQPMPDLVQMPVVLSNTLSRSADTLRAACPQCDGGLQGWLRRDIKHHGSTGELQFSLLRRGTYRMFLFDGETYPTLAALPQPARGLVAEALNEIEES